MSNHISSPVNFNTCMKQYNQAVRAVNIALEDINKRLNKLNMHLYFKDGVVFINCNAANNTSGSNLYIDNNVLEMLNSFDDDRLVEYMTRGY